MYQMICGENPMADALLRTLGLSRNAVGRFRDCRIANGEIAVYTRNGGGNHKECYCEDGFGAMHHLPVPEYEAASAPNEDGTPGHPVCLAPDSADCTCVACITNHRLPQHPCYLRMVEDDVDETYATFYFRFPEEHAKVLRALDTGAKWDPDERWRQAFAAQAGAST
jgi:hypothetical protein